MIVQTSTQCLLECECDWLQDSFASGLHACALSMRSPVKSTPNEDGALLLSLDDQRALFAVVDGCGGMRGGEIAARIALETIEERFADFDEGHSIRETLLDALEDANRTILQRKLGSGCTIAAVTVDHGEMRTYHVGDAKAYLMSNRGTIRYQTICHSPVGYAIASGMLEPRKAMHRPDRNYISNLLGSHRMKVEIGPALAMSSKDRILIASDGLTDNLYESEIIDIVRKGCLEDGVETLSELALARMRSTSTRAPSKADDLTIIAVERSA